MYFNTIFAFQNVSKIQDSGVVDNTLMLLEMFC